MTVKQFLAQTASKEQYPPLRPRIQCNDGFSMSVQGGYGMYSSPRENLITGDFYAVEIGFPSEEETLILEYAEQPEIPTDTVYAYVPVEIVQQVIEKHGGINEAQTFV